MGEQKRYLLNGLKSFIHISIKTLKKQLKCISKKMSEVHESLDDMTNQRKNEIHRL